MFTLTITTRDYIPFTIRGSATDLCTAAIVMQSGLQMRQQIAVEVSGPSRTARITDIGGASELIDAVTDLIEFCTPERGCGMSAVDLRRIPSDYTGCEVYRGYVIAVKEGSYAVFNTEGQGVFTYLKGGFSERCLARAAIDLEYE